MALKYPIGIQTFGHYADAYAAGTRQLIQVAVLLNDNIRNIADWTAIEA